MLFRFCAVTFASLLVACSGSNGTGVFGGPLPSGNVVVSAVAGVTALSAPRSFGVPGTGFAVTVHEDNYPSGFDAAVVSYTSPTTVPCWVISVDQSHEPNIATFVPANVPDPTRPGISVCPVRGDVEQVRFMDQRGNSAIYSFTTQ